MASRGSKRRNPEETQGSKPRQRRRRTAFSDDQLDRLEETFHDEKFPGITTRDQLASELGIGEDRIQVWFQNRRARWRKREIKNKPPQLRPSHVPPTSYQSFSHQTVFPPLPSSFDTRITWTLPAPFTTTTAFGFPPHNPGLPPSSLLQSFPPYTAVRQPLLSQFGSNQVPLATSPRMSATLYDSDSRASPRSSDEYMAAVTLVSAFQRED